LEKSLIIKALEKSQNNKTIAIEFLGISRRTFYEKLEKYQLTKVLPG
jgi:DNA-binding NtrC family response regulator